LAIPTAVAIAIAIAIAIGVNMRSGLRAARWPCRPEIQSSIVVEGCNAPKRHARRSHRASQGLDGGTTRRDASPRLGSGFCTVIEQRMPTTLTAVPDNFRGASTTAEQLFIGVTPGPVAAFLAPEVHPTLLFLLVWSFSPARFRRLFCVARILVGVGSFHRTVAPPRCIFHVVLKPSKVRIDRPRQPRQHPKNQQLHGLWCELELLIGYNLVRLDAPISHRRSRIMTTKCLRGDVVIVVDRQHRDTNTTSGRRLNW
jgi:hypothetical protein